MGGEWELLSRAHLSVGSERTHTRVRHCSCWRVSEAVLVKVEAPDAIAPQIRLLGGCCGVGILWAHLPCHRTQDVLSLSSWVKLWAVTWTTYFKKTEGGAPRLSCEDGGPTFLAIGQFSFGLGNSCGLNMEAS